jgi:hypothetical protein
MYTSQTQSFWSQKFYGCFGVGDCDDDELVVMLVVMSAPNKKQPKLSLHPGLFFNALEF